MYHLRRINLLIFGMEAFKDEAIAAGYAGGENHKDRIKSDASAPDFKG
jgi:hypothetical protein